MTKWILIVLTVGLATAPVGRLDAQAKMPRQPGHVVLIGDSIFDNRRYVGDDPAVIDQLRRALPPGWKATLLAVDGATTRDVAAQLQRLPADATHLVLSVGGNDALMQQHILTRPVRSAAEVFLGLAAVREAFAAGYAQVLEQVLARGKPTAVCTIYDPNFEDRSRQRMAEAALCVFNDGILRAAAERGLPVIDLRLIFTAAEDYANPIEPSMVGGAKMVRMICRVLLDPRRADNRTTIYR